MCHWLSSDKKNFRLKEPATGPDRPTEALRRLARNIGPVVWLEPITCRAVTIR